MQILKKRKTFECRIFGMTVTEKEENICKLVYQNMYKNAHIIVKVKRLIFKYMKQSWNLLQ